MPYRRVDPGVGERAREFVDAYSEKNHICPKDAMRRIGIDRKNYSYWLTSATPSARSLQLLALAGADVHYILTGRRRSGA